MTTLDKSSVAHYSPALPAIVEAMMRPAFYPEHPEKVELIQTHISYVFIAGAFVYKLKKAVRFSFVDCTDLAQRRHLCGEEIRLNRRLAPDVYLGMYPIFRIGPDFVLGDKSTESSPGGRLRLEDAPAARRADARSQVGARRGRPRDDSHARFGHCQFPSHCFAGACLEVRVGLRIVAPHRRRTHRYGAPRRSDADHRTSFR